MHVFRHAKYSRLFDMLKASGEVFLAAVNQCSIAVLAIVLVRTAASLLGVLGFRQGDVVDPPEET